MPIKFRLEGDSKDLGFLAQEFPPSSDPHVGIDSEGYYLTSDPDDMEKMFRIRDDFESYIDDSYDTEKLLAKAQHLLHFVNGTARLIRPDFRPVGLRGDFTSVAGSLRNSLDDDAPWPKEVDRAAEYYERLCAQGYTGKEVLAILGAPKPALDWSDLDKLYEIIAASVAAAGLTQQDIFEGLEKGFVEPGPQERRQALTDTGWVTGANLDAFTSHRMPIEDAQQMITNLIVNWLDSDSLDSL
jgi:hypothetical protein